MRKILYLNILIVFFTMMLSCKNHESNLKDYSNELAIDFPENMELIYFDEKHDFQDYSVISIYKLSFNQKNALVDKIYKNLCENESVNEGCWNKCGNYYSYRFTQEDKSLVVDISFLATNNLSTLSISETKF